MYEARRITDFRNSHAVVLLLLGLGLSLLLILRFDFHQEVFSEVGGCKVKTAKRESDFV